MITPKELFEKSVKQFDKVLKAALQEAGIFPLVISANKQVQGTNFSELKAVLIPLYQQSKGVRGKGYTIEWKDKMIEGTYQKLPARIYFETLEDYLSYTGLQDVFLKAQEAFAIFTKSFPQLSGWVIDNIAFLRSEAGNMPGLVKVCQYFYDNPPPHNYYLRELPIEVHSKFIEDNVKALKRILDILLPPVWINNNEGDFLARYYIKRPNIYTQIRILDEALKPAVGFNELALTLDDSALLAWQPEKVFIIENRACFLSFPNVKNAVAIFGEGFKSRLTRHIPWLAQAALYCWFDLDPAGFEMLNTIREYYPNAKSYLMDAKAYEDFSHFSVTSVYRKQKLDRLLPGEVRLYEFLQANNRRLEQERIAIHYVKNRLP